MSQSFATAVEHHRAGRLVEAVEQYRKAIAFERNFPDAHYNLGIALCAQGEVEAAAACFREAVERRPGFTEACFNLGLVCRKQGKLDEAAACFRTVIACQPDDRDALGQLGRTLRSQDRLDEAVACYTRIVELEPSSGEAHNNLGVLFGQLGRKDDAALCYQRALASTPTLAAAQNNLGVIFRERGRRDEAVVCFLKAIDLEAGFSDAYYNLGLTYRELERLDEAVACYRRAIELRPDYPDALSNLGVALQRVDRRDEAIASYRSGIRLRPDDAEALSNLGGALHQERRFDEAVACLRNAIRLRPDLAEAHCNLALALLGSGQMAEGWTEYEWRWKTPDNQALFRGFAQPLWLGHQAPSRTLLVHAEQGYGDTLQFCRYVRLVAARGLRVVVEVQAGLLRLLKDLPGAAAVVARGEELPAFDFQCPMLSLPLAVGAVPDPAPYLYAGVEDIAIWRERLDAKSRAPVRVGIAWAGSAAHRDNGRRSLDPTLLRSLWDISGVDYVSLQMHSGLGPRTAVLIDLMDCVSDFADTAALIANLDLVISVDTAVAHLAAAMGKPVWMLDRFDHDWRWLAGRRSSTWYPTMRIFRQVRRGDWASVLEEVQHALRRFAANAGSGLVRRPWLDQSIGAREIGTVRSSLNNRSDEVHC